MKKWVVRTLAIAGVVVAVGVAALFWFTRPKPALTVATWEGSYGHAQASAQIMPYGAAHRVNAKFTFYDGGTKVLAGQVASHRYDWDALDMELPDAVAACDSGLLEKIDTASLAAAPDGTPAAADFVPGAIGPCWVASVVYSQVIAQSFDKKVVPGDLAGFFDIKNFPGKRALNKASAKLNVEMALFADGVAPKDIYAVLSSPQGVARALKKLDSLRGALIWYTNPAEAAQMVIDGRAAMASLPNWAVYDANAALPQPKLGIVWDRQLYELEVLAIPKGNPNATRAMDFMRFATRTENLGKMASWVAYGPARKSALALVQKQPELHIDMRPYLPTAHFATAFQIDDGWWRLHGADVAVLWQEWLTKSDPH